MEAIVSDDLARRSPYPKPPPIASPNERHSDDIHEEKGEEIIGEVEKIQGTEQFGELNLPYGDEEEECIYVFDAGASWVSL